MRNLLQHISIFFWVCIGLALGACSSDSISESNILSNEGADNDVILNLRVSIDNDSSTGSTRDGEEEGENTGEDTPEDPEYENVIDPYELINTLRVIIVRPDNTVEYNRPISVKENSMNPTKVLANLEDLKFRVSTSQGFVNIGNNSRTCTEQKRIYLIANEESFVLCGSDYTKQIIEELRKLKPSFYDKVDENETMPISNKGDKLDPDKVFKWLVYNNWSEDGTELYAKPFINNDEPKSGEKMFVPMTEIFDIEVTVDLDRDNYLSLTQQPVNLFITRNFVKFQFEAEGINETFKVHKITFKNLMWKEYMFPFDAKYNPGKYPVSSEKREIIDFKTPGLADNYTRSYEFSPVNFGFIPNPIGDREELNNLDHKYKPQLYFCETKNYETNGERDIYKVGIDIEFFNPDGTSQRIVFEPQELKNLPSIPRNTIVKVKFVIRDREVICNVTLLPYTGVWLRPIFGI